MDFRQLQSFVAVVRLGSFTKAAAQLRVSQPTVSTHVRMLEEELGGPLVVRALGRVEPTPRGEKVLEQAVNMLALRDHMLAAAQVRERDTIYLGASSVPCAYVLPQALAAYRRVAPGTRFAVHQQDSQDVIAGLVEGVYDVALVGMRPDDASLEAAELCGDRLVLAAAPDARFDGLSLDDAAAVRKLLARESLILRSEGSGSRASVDRILDDLGISEEDLSVIARLDDQETIKNLVACDCGVTIISERAVRDRVGRGDEKRGALRAFDLPTTAASRSLYVAWRRGAPADETVRAFLAFMRAWADG